MAAVPSLTSRVEISVSCRNLPDRDVTSKSDPQCILFMRQPGTSKFQELERTERLNNTLDPEFSHRFIVDFMFEERQLVQFQIYDLDSPNARLSDHDFLGELETSIGELVSRRRFETKLCKTKGSKPSIIVITCIEVQECKQVVSLLVEGHKLENKDFLGKSDPFLEIYLPLEDVTSENELNQVRNWTLVHRTEVIKNNLNPRWARFSVPIARFCRGNKSLILRFDCHDYDSGGSHDLIGNFYSNLESLEQEVARSRSAQRTLISKKKKSAGTIVFSQIGIETIDSFVDYIQGGTELHFTAAIDFTGSNGDPRDPRSLHHVSADGRPNQYELAIISVGEIVQDYDSDKQFPCLGFGALLPPLFSGLQDAFSLTLQPENPYCAGMPGLLAAYRSCIRAVRLYGPTNFSPVINHVASMASAHQTGAQYFVLLIITDGIITDFEKTKQAIIKASSLPMSIIIVGVGNEDFSAMKDLDSDDKRLRCGSMIAERDVVQFVPLRRFIQGCNLDRSRYALAKEVLAELPNQVCEWMRRRGIRAGPPRVRGDAPAAGGGAAPYPGAQQAGAPYPGAQQAGGPYPGAQQAGAPYPGAQQAGGPYPGAQQAGGPYPGGQQAGGPYPGAQQGDGPYPGAQQAGGPYPVAHQPGGPYPGAQQAGGPYPVAQQPGGPYPGAQQAGGPYPDAAQSGQGYP